MQLSQQHQRSAAENFVAEWQDKGNERQHAQSFWLELLRKVYGVANPAQFISFEKPTSVDESTKFVDGFIEDTHVLIEQKGSHINLDTAEKQSDGALLTPFQQAKRYADNLPYYMKPRYIICCNFKEFHIYDMNETQPEKHRYIVKLADLPREFSRLQFLVDEKNAHLQKELDLSVAAGKIVGEIYDALLPQYRNLTVVQLRSLNILCVRLVFCLYAEDTGLFNSKNQFHDYLNNYSAEDMREALIKLFEVLCQKENERDPYLKPQLAAFPYVNGGLFEESDIEIPNFTAEIREMLLQKASADFNWSDISPTIFGAVFESTLNPDTRRSGGMHYTSIENIHKVIDPLFLDALKAELENALAVKSENARKAALTNFQKKIAGIKFFDPACGSGNFLTETYLSLRKLENTVLKNLAGGQIQFGADFSPIMVNINQFYGIEINDFAVTVARTALWIAESQTMRATERIVASYLHFLPLKSNANIVEGNALRMDWREVFRDEGKGTRTESFACHPEPMHSVQISGSIQRGKEMPKQVRHDTSATPSVEVTGKAEAAEHAPLSQSTVETSTTHNLEPTTYIMGNPPFVGARWMSKEQKKDVLDIFGSKWNGVGDLDYVTCWYKKATDFIQNTNIRCALVSTNSITQGGAVANIWKPLFEKYNLRFDFAYQTFKWDSESTDKAAVHCVIIGFSCERAEGNTCHFDRAQASGEIYKRKRIDLSTSATPSVEVTGKAETAEHAPLSHSKADVTSSAVEKSTKIIFDTDGTPHEAANINGYLLDAENIFIEKRLKPISDVPEICLGGQAIDDGNLVLTIEEKNELLKKEPQAEKFLRPYMMGKDFINRKPRACLWLLGGNPSELKKCPQVMERVRKVKEFRLASSRTSTLRAAETPTLFASILECENDYIAIPKVSSENRKYIPIDYLTKEIIPGDKLFTMQNATLFHFGVLTSSVHNAWMRAVCGRLKSDYSYSNTIVYNNFVWCEPTDAQRQQIEKTAQGILDARAKYPNASLADLYDTLTMPPDLRKAHQANDQAVLAAYGWAKDITESEIVAKLMQMYQEMVK